MNCPYRDKILHPSLSADEEASLVAHARDCSECSHRRATLNRSRAVLQSDLPDLDRVMASRWLATAKAQQRPPRTWALPVAATVALAAAIFAFVSVRSPTASVEPRVAVAELRTNEMVETKSARWVALSGFRLTRLPSLDTEIMRINSGHLEVELLDSARTAIVETHAGLIKLEGGQYELRVDQRGAVLKINKGQAELSRGDKTLNFGAGKTIRLTAGEWPPEVQTPRTVEISRASTNNPTTAANQQRQTLAESTSQDVRPTRARRTTSQRHQERLTEARALLGQDNQKAVALAEAVISDNPSDAPIEASMIAADGYRRRGQAEKAEQLYHRVAAHPDGAQFADEALTRRAVSLAERGLDNEALLSLKKASLRFDGQGLAPERAALEARIHLRANRSHQAADVLLRLSDRRDRVLNAPRIETAEALPGTDPRRVRLLESVVHGGGPRARRARDLLTSEKKNTER